MEETDVDVIMREFIESKTIFSHKIVQKHKNISEKETHLILELLQNLGYVEITYEMSGVSAKLLRPYKPELADSMIEEFGNKEVKKVKEQIIRNTPQILRKYNRFMSKMPLGEPNPLKQEPGTQSSKEQSHSKTIQKMEIKKEDPRIPPNHHSSHQHSQIKYEDPKQEREKHTHKIPSSVPTEPEIKKEEPKKTQNHHSSQQHSQIKYEDSKREKEENKRKLLAEEKNIENKLKEQFKIKDPEIILDSILESLRISKDPSKIKFDFLTTLLQLQKDNLHLQIKAISGIKYFESNNLLKQKLEETISQHIHKPRKNIENQSEILDIIIQILDDKKEQIPLNIKEKLIAIADEI